MTRRALLTDTEREILESGEKTERYHKEVYRIRQKIGGRLVDDVDILAEHHPELLDELRAVVCADEPEEKPE